jgi:uncharacterized protein YihD (DUF1040 family)
MRDPNRIPVVLSRLQAVWKKYPDLRLGQLITNVFRSDSLYYLEDDRLIDIIEEFYKLKVDKDD